MYYTTIIPLLLVYKVETVLFLDYYPLHTVGPFLGSHGNLEECIQNETKEPKIQNHRFHDFPERLGVLRRHPMHPPFRH